MRTCESVFFWEMRTEKEETSVTSHTEIHLIDIIFHQEKQQKSVAGDGNIVKYFLF